MKTTILIGIAHLLQDLYPAFLPAITFIFKEDFSLNYFEVSLILVCCRLPCLFNPFIGALSERLNVRYFIIIPPLSTALFIGLLSFANCYWQILLLTLLAGFSSQIFHVPAPVILKKITSQHAGKNMSIFMVGGELSRTLAPLLISWFLTYFRFDQIYLLSSLGILYFLFLLFYFHLKLDVSATPPLKLGVAWKLFYKKKNLIMIIIGPTLSKAFTASAVISLIALFLKEQNYSAFMSSNSLSIIAISSLLGVSLTGPLSDKFGRHKLIMFSLIASPIALLMLLISPPSFMLPALFLFGFVSCSSAPVVMTYVQELGQEIPSFANGIYMAFNFLLTSIIVLIIGHLADGVGIRQALYISCLLSLLGLAVVTLGKRGSPSSQQRL